MVQNRSIICALLVKVLKYIDLVIYAFAGEYVRFVDEKIE